MSRLQRAVLLILFCVIFGLCYAAIRISNKTEYPKYSDGHEESNNRGNNNEPSETLWQWLTKDAASFFTAVLALLTAVLAGVSVIQIVYLRRADDTARIAANAAQKSADILVSLERPWLVPKVVQTGFNEHIEMLANDLSFDPLIAEIPLVFINEGKTTAFIKTLKVEHAIAEYEAPLKGQGRGTEIDYDGETVSPGAKLETVMGLGFYIDSKDAIYIIENGGVALW